MSFQRHSYGSGSSRSNNFFRSSGSEALPKPPFVIVSNHGTFFDPWIIGYFSRYPFAIMCNDDAFRGSPITRWYLNSIGAFPKKKGASDFKAMKKTMSSLAAGRPVCIFPEGQTSWDGETQLLYKGIEKIIRHGRVPLVMVRMSGNFLTKPWWADRIRKGRIECLFQGAVAGPHPVHFGKRPVPHDEGLHCPQRHKVARGSRGILRQRKCRRSPAVCVDMHEL